MPDDCYVCYSEPTEVPSDIITRVTDTVTTLATTGGQAPDWMIALAVGISLLGLITIGVAFAKNQRDNDDE